MFAVTFYSYKGGVGRTSALMNCAYRLADMGKRVFVLDFDLEAPGIDSFDFSQPNAMRPGLVEYIAKFIESNEVSSLDEFVFEVPRKGTEGCLMIMPAGRRDENYQASLSKLDWKLLYRQKSGFLFVENIKAAIREKYAPDYLLIDSRTGLTDVSGICTLQLPDLVALLFSLNNQSVRGTAQIYKSIKSNKLNREIKTLLVASPIPDVPESVEIRRDRFENARRCIGGAAPDLILPYDPFMAFQETIAGTAQSQGLMRGYDELTNLIIDANSTDTLTLLREARRLTDAGNAELAELKYREVLEARPDSWEGWINFGIFQRTRRHPQDAAKCFGKALELAPNSVRALAQLSATLLELDKLEDAKAFAAKLAQSASDANELTELGRSFQARGVPDAAYALYKKAASVSPNEDTFYLWGETATAMGLFEEAYDAYRRAMDQEPTSLAPVFNTAYVANKLGRPEARMLFQKSVELFEHRQESSGRDANAFAAISEAYLAIGRPHKALRHLRTAMRMAASAESPRIFSPSRYTYIPKKEFLDETENRIRAIEAEHREIPPDSSQATILTAIKSQGAFSLTFKNEEKTLRRTIRTASDLVDLLASLGIDRRASARIAETLGRGHPVQTSLDVDPDLLFGTSE